MANTRDFRNKNTVFTGTEGVIVPKGTTGERVGTDVGKLRYNTSTGFLEQYNSVGWTAIAAPPVVTGVSPTTFSGTSGTSFTISGSAFDTNASVTFVTALGAELNAASVTRNSSSELVATTPRDILVSEEPISIKVVNGTGLSSVLSDAIDAGGAPTWNTSAGTLATINDTGGSYSPIATVSATDPEGGAVTYSVTSGSIPAGTTFDSNAGTISGDPTNVNSQTTSTFEITATDGVGNGTPRTFNIIVNPVLDGSSSGRAGASASAIKSLTGTTTDGLYWINWNGSPVQVYCDMNSDGGGWMLTYRVDANGNNSCGNGTWDFSPALGGGGSSHPTNATSTPSNGSGEGLSPSNRQSFWSAMSGSEVAVSCGRGSTVDLFFEQTLLNDTANLMNYAAYGYPNPSSGYFNTTVGSNIARVISASRPSLSAGSTYQIYGLGGWNCNCCESYHINGNWDAGDPAAMIFGDGPRNGSVVTYDWCNFWIR